MIHPYLPTALCRGIIVNDRVYFSIEIANTRNTQNMLRKGLDIC